MKTKADIIDLDKQAIDAALNRNWKQALNTNTQILKTDPKNIEALNRLGRALMETGAKTRAAEIYQKVLRLDKFNSIAKKNLELVKISRVSRHNQSSSPPPPPIFIEEPGSTKTVNLVRVGDPKIVSRLRPGDPLTLAVREHCISVSTYQKEYIGRLPDDLGSRLSRFIKGGNKYQAWVKSLQPLKIFIIESLKTSVFANIPSFPVTEKLNYAAFTPPELIHDQKPDTASTEEDVSDQNAEVTDIEDTGPKENL